LGLAGPSFEFGLSALFFSLRRTRPDAAGFSVPQQRRTSMKTWPFVVLQKELEIVTVGFWFDISVAASL
jgi:hypothetical protein